MGLQDIIISEWVEILHLTILQYINACKSFTCTESAQAAADQTQTLE